MELLGQISMANLTAMLLFVVLFQIRKGVKEWGRGKLSKRVSSAVLNFGMAAWFLYLTFINGRTIFNPSDKIGPTYYYFFGVVIVALDIFIIVQLQRRFKANKQNFIDWYRKGNLLCRPRPKEGNYKAYF